MTRSGKMIVLLLILVSANGAGVYAASAGGEATATVIDPLILFSVPDLAFQPLTEFRPRRHHPRLSADDAGSRTGSSGADGSEPASITRHTSFLIRSPMSGDFAVTLPDRLEIRAGETNRLVGTASRFRYRSASSEDFTTSVVTVEATLHLESLAIEGTYQTLFPLLIEHH